MLTTLQKSNRVNPIASTSGLEHLILQWLATEAMSTKIAYKEPKESFTELLLELQLGDASVGKQKCDNPEESFWLARSKRDQ